MKFLLILDILKMRNSTVDDSAIYIFANTLLFTYIKPKLCLGTSIKRTILIW